MHEFVSPIEHWLTEVNQSRTESASTALQGGISMRTWADANLIALETELRSGWGTHMNVHTS
jgi:hypothetical protein